MIPELVPAYIIIGFRNNAILQVTHRNITRARFLEGFKLMNLLDFSNNAILQVAHRNITLKTFLKWSRSLYSLTFAIMQYYK